MAMDKVTDCVGEARQKLKSGLYISVMKSFSEWIQFKIIFLDFIRF